MAKTTNATRGMDWMSQVRINDSDVALMGEKQKKDSWNQREGVFTKYRLDERLLRSNDRVGMRREPPSIKPSLATRDH